VDIHNGNQGKRQLSTFSTVFNRTNVFIIQKFNVFGKTESLTVKKRRKE